MNDEVTQTPHGQVSIKRQCELFGSDLIDLLRREGQHSNLWFADRLLVAAEHLERLSRFHNDEVVERSSIALEEAWNSGAINGGTLPPIEFTPEERRFLAYAVLTAALSRESK